jgi:hypothetical protein
MTFKDFLRSFRPDGPPAITAEAAMEESLIPDARAGLSPAQLVERKVEELLDASAAGRQRTQE